MAVFESIPQFGMVHGRFQPFHNGHLEYVLLAQELCQTLIVGITNPDPMQVAEEPTSPHRHLAEANPFTYFERQLMIRRALLDEGILAERLMFVPFPINLPDRWPFYAPPNVTHYVRVFSEWEATKVERLRKHGFAVVVLQPGAPKKIEGAEVRRRIVAGEAWDELVPRGAADVIKSVIQNASTGR